MFHRVLPDVPAAFGLPGCYRIRGTALTPDEFVRALDEAGPILPLDAVEVALRAGTDLPPGAVLTFDDGYREHLDVVAPLLTERGQTATFYVSAGLHGAGSAVAAVDAWYWLLDHGERPLASVPMPAGGIYSARIDTVEGKSAWVVGPPKQALLAADPDLARSMVDALAESVRCTVPEDLAARLYMTTDDWRRLAEGGMRVGAHGVTHRRLNQATPHELADEVAHSCSAVAGLSPTVTFAYPDGAFDEAVIDALRRAGVKSAVTCVPGSIENDVDPLLLPRSHICPS